MSDNINPRWAMYLKTTKKPTNHGFMSFICTMSKRYKKEKGIDCIDNQDAFTQFISDNIEE